MPKCHVARRPGRSIPFTLLLAAVCLAAAALPAAAQVNNGAIEAVVVDGSNLPLPGVTFRVTSPATGFDTSGVTGSNGMVRIGALPPGHYDLTFELQGFNTLIEKGVAVLVGQTVVVTATLQAKLTETVTVTAQAPVVDVHKLDTSANILPEQIEMLPVSDRDFQKLSFIAPTVQRERGAFRFVTGGPVIGAGGNASQSTILVDGVDFTDPALGLATTRFSQDAIREFRVIADQFDPEVGGTAGGGLSIVTRSGTNMLDGSAFGYFRSKAFRAMGALDLAKPDFSRQQFGGSLGGPIVKDKAHFFASVEQIDDNSTTLFRPKGAFASLAADVPQPTRQTLLFGRVDNELTANQRLSTKIVYERFREDNFRVGGVADVTQGLRLNRDNVNVNSEWTWVGGANRLNQFYVQVARRKYEEPGNTPGGMAVWYSSGNTLQTGGSIYDGMLGDGVYAEFRDTFTIHKDTGHGVHDIKFGGGWQIIHDRYRLNTYPAGLLMYLTDTTALPLAYVGGTGSADVTITTNRLDGFVLDNWAVRRNLTVNLGLRYDVDTNGNNPGFTQPAAGLTTPRPRDLNNVQPRASMSWDLTGNGQNVVRAGAGLFTGRFLLVPPEIELQQNGLTGRITQMRVNGALYGYPTLALDPLNPTTTGIPQKYDIALLAQDYVAPQAVQTSAGYTRQLGRTGLFLDTQFVYVHGWNEVALTDKNYPGNAAWAGVRPNTSYNQINVYTNEGHSNYIAGIVSLNGTIKGGHLVTFSYTVARKKNISDDFSPEFPTGYPNDPSNLQAEYGRSRSDERQHIVFTGVFRLPYRFSLAPIVEYGTGQPWTQRLGYDYNGDGKNSDRPTGVGRFTMDGPSYKNVSVRLTKTIPLPGRNSVDLIAEVFNLFNTVNYDVSSLDGALYLNGPTILNPATAYLPNPNYGRYSATLAPRELQLGVRWTF